jgi:uncharacterized protein (TIGR02246 family)
MPSDEEQIRQLVATWIAETNTGNVDAVLNLMAEDVVFLVTGRPPMVGKAAFAAALQPSSVPGEGKRPEIEGTSEIQEIRVLGDWAFMWTKLKIVVTPPGGASMTRAGYTLSVLQKHDGRWVLARDANMLAPVE